MDEFGDLIRAFVDRCRDAGDRITERHVLEDPIMMQAFRDFYALGESEGLSRNASKSAKSVLEAHQELVRMTKSRDDAVRNNSKLMQDIESLKADKIRIGNEHVAKSKVIRQLQGQIDDLRSWRREFGEFRKIKKKLEIERSECERLAALVNTYAPAYAIIEAMKRQWKEKIDG